MNAVVFGATGAIGREVVTTLAGSDKWAKVVACVRRPVEKTEWVPEGEAGASKIEVKVVNFDDIPASLPASALSGLQTSFYCLGTTRKDAGSAEAFKTIDLGYLQAIAPICKEAGMRHFSLVSSQGADASSSFLYMKTKGECENLVKDLQFAHTSIWQPGLLARGGKARFVEKIGNFIMSGMPVATVAKAMVADAEAKASADPTPAQVFLNKDITALTK